MRRLNLTFLLGLFLGCTVLGQGDSDAALQSSADQMKRRESIVTFRRIPRGNLQKVKMPKELKEKLSVTDLEKQIYQHRAADSKIQILKLWNNQCTHLTKVIDVEKDRDCLTLSEYFAGATYSFENKTYYKQGELAHLNAGLDLVDNQFRTVNLALPMRGFNNSLIQVLTDVGVKDIGAIEKNSPEVKNLLALRLFDERGRSVWKEESANYESKGIKIADSFSATMNHTYLLRSIFYDRHQLNPSYKETVYAFQLVKFEDNIATILWKKISSRRM